MRNAKVLDKTNNAKFNRKQITKKFFLKLLLLIIFTPLPIKFTVCHHEVVTYTRYGYNYN